VAYFKVFYRYLPGGTQKNYKKASLRIAGQEAEIWTQDPHNTRKERQYLWHEVQYTVGQEDGLQANRLSYIQGGSFPIQL
jgi:hypothetical protein